VNTSPNRIIFPDFRAEDSGRFEHVHQFDVLGPGVPAVTKEPYPESIESFNTLIQCCGSGMFIPDPGSEFFHPGSRVAKIQLRIQGSKKHWIRNNALTLPHETKVWIIRLIFHTLVLAEICSRVFHSPGTSFPW
jgi:hypothetical protein